MGCLNRSLPASLIPYPGKCPGFGSEEVKSDGGTNARYNNLLLTDVSFNPAVHDFRNNPPNV